MDEDAAREIAELKARCDRLEEALAKATEARVQGAKGLIETVAIALAQCIGLQIVASKLLAEVALLHKDPEAKLSMVSAELLGNIEGAGGQLRKEAALAAHATQLIETVLTTADGVLRDYRARRR